MCLMRCFRWSIQLLLEWLEESYETEQAKEIMQLREELNLKRYLERDDNIRYELFIINNLQENVEQYAGLHALLHHAVVS